MPVLGRLPSDSFAGFDNDDDDAAAIETADKQEEGEEAEIPPSTLGSGGVYHIDKFNKQI